MSTDLDRTLTDSSATDTSSGDLGTVAQHRSRRRLVPVGIVFGWLVIIGVLAVQAGNLGQVVESGAAAYLPAKSQSKQVIDTTEQYGDEPALPATVVWSSSTKLTAKENAAIGAQIDALKSEFTDDLTDAGVRGPIPSDDEHAVRAVLPFAGNDTDVSSGHVTAARELLSADPPAGVRVDVTGPAGVQADMKDALGAIDVTLVLVAAGVILIILFAVYRSLLLPLLVIGVGGAALGCAMGALYLLARTGVISIGSEVQGIISVLVLGCATDYAMLLIARFSAELRGGSEPPAAMRVAWRSTVAPVIASASTVILGLLCLLFSDLGLNRQLGPAAAVGVFFAMAAMLTLMPAILVLLGRSAFWPRRLRPQRENRTDGPVVRQLERRPRRLWTITAAILAFCAVGALGMNAGGLTDGDMVLGDDVESRVGQEHVDDHFPKSVGSPAVILVDVDQQKPATKIAESAPGVESVSPWTNDDATSDPVVVDGRVRLDASLSAAPDSTEAMATVQRLRDRLANLETSEPTLVGGQDAVKLDFNQTASGDRWVLGLLLCVVLLVVALLLRSVVAPLVIVASVVLSFLAAIGVATVLFQRVLGFPGVDASFPIHAFVFLVALGVDYSIFLMSRVRERVLVFGPHRGVLEGLTQTSTVIVSAGIVLSATFAALALVPLVLMVQLAFIVAFGVLMDTLIVRSILVPALALDLGRVLWWPNRRISQMKSTAPEVRAGPDH